MYIICETKTNKGGFVTSNPIDVAETYQEARAMIAGDYNLAIEYTSDAIDYHYKNDKRVTD